MVFFRKYKLAGNTMEVVEANIDAVQSKRRTSDQLQISDRPVPKTLIIPKSKSVDKELSKRPSPPVPFSQSTGKLATSPAIEPWANECELVTHRGGCHCGAVRFEAYAPEILTSKECNCTMCQKKRMKFFTVPIKNFKLLQGHNSLTTYSFGTHKAKHNFCSVCGVESFFIPRDNPDGYAVVVSTVEGGSIKKIKAEKVNLKNKK